MKYNFEKIKKIFAPKEIKNTDDPEIVRDKTYGEIGIDHIKLI